MIRVKGEGHWTELLDRTAGQDWREGFYEKLWDRTLEKRDP